MSATIVKPSTLDNSLVNFGEPQSNSHGGKSLKIGYSQEGKLLIQAPPMYIPWDISKEEMKSDAPTSKDAKTVVSPSGVKYSMQLSFRGMDGTDVNAKRLSSFHNMIHQLDNLLVETASINSLTWLKMKTAPKPVVEALVNSTIKVSKDAVTQEPDGKYPDTIKVRIPYYVKDDRLGCAFFDKDGKQLVDMSVLSRLRRGTQVACILECGGVYFSNGKFGMTWSLYQCAIKSESSSRIPKGICLITDSDDELDTYEPVSVSVHKPTSNQVSFTNKLVQDENDDDELDHSPVHPVNTPTETKPVVSEAVGTKKVIRKPISAVKK